MNDVVRAVLTIQKYFRRSLARRRLKKREHKPQTDRRAEMRMIAAKFMRSPSYMNIAALKAASARPELLGIGAGDRNLPGIGKGKASSNIK